MWELHHNQLVWNCTVVHLGFACAGSYTNFWTWLCLEKLLSCSACCWWWMEDGFLSFRVAETYQIVGVLWWWHSGFACSTFLLHAHAFLICFVFPKFVFLSVVAYGHQNAVGPVVWQVVVADVQLDAVLWFWHACGCVNYTFCVFLLIWEDAEV